MTFNIYLYELLLKLVYLLAYFIIVILESVSLISIQLIFLIFILVWFRRNKLTTGCASAIFALYITILFFILFVIRLNPGIVLEPIRFYVVNNVWGDPIKFEEIQWVELLILHANIFITEYIDIFYICFEGIWMSLFGCFIVLLRFIYFSVIYFFKILNPTLVGLVLLWILICRAENGGIVNDFYGWILGQLDIASNIFGYSTFREPWYLDSLSRGDNLSMVFVGLTTFIFPLCIMSNWDFFKLVSVSEAKIYLCSLLFLEYFIIQAFCTKNIFFFYMFFEATLLPMILLIGIWGPTPRKIKASYYLVFYTLGGSILFLFAILVIIVEQGTADLEQLIILGPIKNLRLQLFLWCCVSLAFAVKMPIFPFHIWLPEAHVEAPTVGSVILAALLLKLGGYGFIRFIPLFPYAYFYFMPLMYTLGVVSIVYASLITIRQIDLKKIIAYSSVAHMNLGTVGIFSLNLQGLQGSILLMVSHGIVSSALFFLVGMLYSRKSSKLLDYYGGLVTKMPIFTTFFFFFSLANLAFPGTANFVGELLILIGISESNLSIMILAASGMLFSSLYSIWLFNRLCFGNPKVKYDTDNSDMSRLEFYYMFPLMFVTLLLGIYPSWLLEYTVTYTRVLLQYLNIN